MSDRKPTANVDVLVIRPSGEGMYRLNIVINDGVISVDGHELTTKATFVNHNKEKVINIYSKNFTSELKALAVLRMGDEVLQISSRGFKFDLVSNHKTPIEEMV
tara:strand:- start:92825 stop:93136 length:312 start_codon:yes stop_codon:yes gene_type:complete